MSDELSRKYIDDVGRRNNNKDSYKNRYFREKRTAEDEYTGRKVFYSSKGKFTPETTSNVDHVVPIHKLKEKYGDSLSKSELKSIANSDYNLAVTSQRLNTSKKALDNHQYLIRQLKSGNPENVLTTYNMLKVEVQGKASAGAQTTTIMGVKAAGSAIDINRRTKNKNSITAEALYQMEYQRNSLKDIIAEQFLNGMMNNLIKALMKYLQLHYPIMQMALQMD